MESENEGEKEMLKICDDRTPWTEVDKRQQSKTFTICRDLFSKVHAYVLEHKIQEGTCFPILDESGKFLFSVVFLEDLIADKRRKDFSDYEARFRNDVQNLDFTFLDRFRKFVFLEVEDYSLAMAKLILEYRPEKEVFFADKRAKYFLDGRVKYPHLLYDAGKAMEMIEEWQRGNGGRFVNRLKAFAGWKFLERLRVQGDCCIVKADRRNHPGDGIVYNSQNVMYSLLWKKKVRNFGEKNPDKEIVILDYPCQKEGLGSIAGYSFAHIMWMTKSGCVPVMDLHTLPNQYLNGADENMWEYFFEPVSQVTVEDAYQSKNVIVATESDISRCDVQINLRQREGLGEFAYKKEFMETVRINRQTKEYIDTKVPPKIREGKRVLGVIARGTDYRNAAALKMGKPNRADVMEIDRFIGACDYYKKKLNCEYVFVATEDSDYFERFRNRFGEKLLSVPQKRVAYDYEHKECKYVSDLLAAEDGKEFGRNYLAVIQSLTECNALLYNVYCGAVKLAWLWEQDRYELFKRIDESWEGESQGKGR